MGIKRIERRRRRRARRRKIGAGLLIIVLALVPLLLSVTTKEREVIGYVYTSTDTLWSLLRYCPEDMDRWEYIELIMDINGMDDMTIDKYRLYEVPIFEK